MIHYVMTVGRVVLLALIIGGSVPMPVWSLDPDRAIDQYTRQSWSIEQGLPQSSVTAIVQGPDDYLYIATFGGLLRFDGIRFVPIEDGGGCGNRFATLAVDGSDTIWAGASRGPLCHIENERLVPFRSAQDGMLEVVRVLEADSAGGLWVGTVQGLVRIDGDSMARLGPAEGLPDPHVIALAASDQGQLWVGTHGGLCQLADGRCKTPAWAKSLLGQPIGAIRVQSNGDIWVASLNTLHVFDGTDLVSVKRPADSGTVEVLFEDGDGNLWMGDARVGLHRLRPRMEEVGPGSPLRKAVSAISEDREGNLWIGSRGAGLTRLTDGSAVARYLPNRIDSLGVMPIVESPAGGVWAGAGCTGLVHVDGDEITVEDEQTGLANGCVWSLLAEPDGHLWLGTLGAGLAERTADGQMRMREGPATRERLVRALARENVTGDLLVGTDEGVYRHGAEPGDFRLVSGTAGFDVHFIKVTRDDTIWVGTRTGALRIDQTRIKRFTTDNGLSNDHVRAIKVDPDGVVWMGTYGGGLHRLSNDRVTVYDVQAGMPDNIVSRIIEDAAGRFWLTANAGVMRIEREKLEAYARGEIDQVNARLFNVRDGMPISETNGGGQPAGLLRTNGELWVPTVNGVAIFDTVGAEVDLPPPSVRIERVVVDGELLDLDGELRLQPTARNLEIHYTAPSFRAPESVRFRYRLDGHDERWNDAGPRRVAYYPVIPPGELVFRVAAASGSGAWSENEATLTLNLPPRLTQRPIFFVLLGLGTASLVALVMWWRNRTLRRRQHQLEEEVARRTSELALLAELTETINRAVKLEDVLDHIFDNLQGLIPYDRIGLALLDSSRTKVRSVWSRSHSSPVGVARNYQVPIEDGALNRMLDSGEPRIVTDLRDHLSLHPDSDSTRQVLKEGIRSNMIYPLKAPGRAVGFLFFSSRRPDVYRTSHVRFLRQLAGHLSLVVGKSEVYEDLLKAKQDLEASNERLKRLAAVDGLTGIANRRAFDQRLRHEWSRLARVGGTLNVLMIDVDSFKPFNDHYGHQAGDDCLKAIAEALNSKLRRELDLVARVGGEEFAVILAETDTDAAACMAEQLRRAVEELDITHEYGAASKVVTVSIGVASRIPSTTQTAEALLQAADRALYEAKGTGRNRVCFAQF